MPSVSFKHLVASCALLIASGFTCAGEKAPAPPSTPAEILKGVKVEKGFEVNVFASPPNVSYPVCISAAPTGELFVGVDENGSLDRNPGRGRVVRCVDTKGDGVADKFTTFCQVDSPRGLFFDNNMLIVLHPPVIEAYYDDEGKGVANRHETLVTGLGFGLDARGADHTTNGIRYGIDGWIYIAMGDYGSPNAVGKDGSKLKHRGGGIMRFRPDGTELEKYVVGTRNICDMAVDPFMNIYTVDNTNDGGGWWVRLAHDIQSGNYGYPTLYMNFDDEMIKPLADYGGGSPTGALYLHEPGFPKDHGSAFYMCEWGHGKVIRHPLTPNGATFKAPQQKSDERLPFVEFTRPTDIDVDGASHFFASSWKGATFTYDKANGGNVGFIVRVVDPSKKQPAFPNLKTASDDDLLTYMASPSHVYHTHTQREILRRSAKPVFVNGLEKLAADNQDLAVRVAAIYTLKQLLGEKAKDVLVKLSAQDELREHCLRALTDRKKECGSLDIKLFTDALNDLNPRVRNQAAISLGRIGKVEAGEALTALMADADPVIVHIAINNLVELKASAALFKALESGDAKLRYGASRGLQALHENAVVDGLIQRVDKTQDPYQKQAVLKALCRLYNREQEWDGSIKTWWGTRPDTTGPYYTPETWERSEDIGKTLKTAMTTSDAGTVRWLVPEMVRNRIDLPDITALLIKMANEDPTYKATAAGVFLGKKNLPKEAIPIVAEVAALNDAPAALRAKALRALGKNLDQPSVLDAFIKASATIDNKANKDVLSARDEVVREPKCAQFVNAFVKHASSGSMGERQAAYQVLLAIHSAQKASKEQKDTSAKAIDSGWTNAESTPALLHAITYAKAGSYSVKIRAAAASTVPAVADAAKACLKELKFDDKNTAPAAKKVAIGALESQADYDKVVAAVQKETGNRELGEELFKKQNCIACHTVNKNDPPKGPYLGDIVNRYKRPELLESILRPNAKITQGFETIKYKMKDGRVMEGFVVKKGDDEIEIRSSPTEQLTLQVKDIASSKPHENFSIMPEGLVKDLSTQELASILAYLDWLNEQAKK
ncbi:MAG: HEAT repeat domain-containing protein [Planctomycetota bacterium]